ncbi:hypothetical protein EDC96DRAFT_493514 [Choanephora cucurbitarum]|nr:hypothetical protein EDC96DRAFT_493514 [Choanephora cucurbitarum]
MATAHEIHRVMDERLLFGAFQRQSHHIKSFPSELVHLPGQQRRPPIRSSNSTIGSRVQPSHYKSKASSEILQTEPSRENYRDSPEAEAIDRWFENIQRYEQMLEEVAAASLDQDFKDELQHINTWLQCRSDAERTAALYTIVQNASQIQIRFLITVLQKLANSHSDPYPAGQDTTSNSEIISYYRSLHVNNSQSVISSEADRRRHLYPPPVSTNNRKFGRFSSAVSEPNDVGRQNRELFASGSLAGGLSHPGPLYEKALAARAQLQAMSSQDTSAQSSTATSSILSSSSSSSSSSLGQHGSTGGLFLSPPKLRSPSSTNHLNTQPLFSPRSAKDWPFPIGTDINASPENDRQSWSFGSLTNKKKHTANSAPGSTASSVIGTKRNEDRLPWTIQEEQEDYSKLSATITSSLNALEQAQARLKQELPHSKPSLTNKPSIVWSPKVSPIQTPKTDFIPGLSPSPSTPLPKQVAFAFTETNNEQAVHEEEKQLTGLARRRKRSSAARALKDKIAAETVDFELMKDVQNWLRSLRLHKYGHAFIGLDWKQVVRMSDQDMIDAGVNTIGARRKLLKVFENVVNHCEENDIEY